MLLWLPATMIIIPLYLDAVPESRHNTPIPRGAPSRVYGQERERLQAYFRVENADVPVSRVHDMTGLEHETQGLQVQSAWTLDCGGHSIACLVEKKRGNICVP